MRASRPLPRRVIRRSIATALVAVMASVAVALATTSTASRHPSPFAACTDGQSEGPPPGVVQVNAEVEPFVDVNPTDGDNVVGVWQADRWTDGGAHGNDTAYSTDGGASWSYPTPIPWSTCAGSPEDRYQRATDPWVSFGPTGSCTPGRAVARSQRVHDGHPRQPLDRWRRQLVGARDPDRRQRPALLQRQGIDHGRPD